MTTDPRATEETQSASGTQSGARASDLAGGGRRAPLRELADAVRRAAAEIVGDLALRREITLERPPKPELGDYSTNAALMLSGVAKQPPRQLAERMGEGLARSLGGRMERFEVAGPGFLNLFLDDEWHLSALSGVLSEGEGFGSGGARGSAQRVLVEFVSANPTGPMHVGHARNAAYGDALCRLLSFHGEQVTREFYVNDAGSQVRKLGESIQALARGEQVPADGYKGDYVDDLARQLPQAGSKDPAELGRLAVGLVIEQIKQSLSAFRVTFDSWLYETTLHEPRVDLSGPDGKPLTAVEHALDLLGQQGRTYTSDGALWLRSTEFGDDKDRVLLRSNGEHTYFASDIAYHLAKRERGFQRQIDVWGADHHGYMPRMKAAYQALGGDPDELEMLIMQLVHLVRGGQRAQMSKRAGEFVTVDDLLEEIGVDAARWYLLSRSHDTTIDLDLDLAIKQSSENPVYYVQYAHARIASVLEKAGEERVASALSEQPGGLCQQPGGPGRTGAETQPLHPSERALVKLLLEFPSEVAEAASRRAPHRIASYALDLAQRFTAFYRDCKVVGAEQASIESTRIALSVATQGALRSALHLLGVSAPQSM